MCGLFLLSAEGFSQTEAFIWLLGTWKNEKRDIYEHWRPDIQSGFAGKSYRIIAGDTALIDEMKIYRENGLYYYLPGKNGKGSSSPLLIRRMNSDYFFAEDKSSNTTRRIVYNRRRNHMQKNLLEAGNRSGSNKFIKLD